MNFNKNGLFVLKNAVSEDARKKTRTLKAKASSSTAASGVRAVSALAKAFPKAAKIAGAVLGTAACVFAAVGKVLWGHRDEVVSAVKSTGRKHFDKNKKKLAKSGAKKAGGKLLKTGKSAAINQLLKKTGV